MKRWILGDATARELGLDLKQELDKLENYKTISFTVDGQRKVFTVEELKQRAHMELGCQACLEKQLRIDALEAELQRIGKPEVPPLESIVRKFIEENYERTYKRLYSRELLRSEIDSYMKRTYNIRVFRDGNLWNFVVKDVLHDKNRQYRKFKLRKRDGGRT
jgi:hypothetical protein